MSRTNENRVETAEQALEAANRSRGEAFNGPSDCDVTDLLADLMHYCEANEIDFDTCLSMATDHYSEEKEHAS